MGKVDDEEDAVVLSFSRGAKLARSAPSTSRATTEGDVVGTWEKTCAPTTSIATLYRLADGHAFDEKRFTMKLTRATTTTAAAANTTATTNTTTTTTMAKSAVDFASFATLETSGVDVRRTFELGMKNGRGVARVTCDLSLIHI